MALHIDEMADMARLASENLARNAVIQYVNDINNGVVRMPTLELLPSLNMFAEEHGIELARHANHLAAFCLHESVRTSIWFVRYGNDVFRVTLVDVRAAEVTRMFLPDN